MWFLPKEAKRRRGGGAAAGGGDGYSRYEPLQGGGGAGKIEVRRFLFPGKDYDANKTSAEVVGPKLVGVRRQTLLKFGKQCFLGNATHYDAPNKTKQQKETMFPICNYRTGHLSLVALKAAATRASILKARHPFYEHIAELATKLRRRHFPNSYGPNAPERVAKRASKPTKSKTKAKTKITRAVMVRKSKRAAVPRKLSSMQKKYCISKGVWRNPKTNRFEAISIRKCS